MACGFLDRQRVHVGAQPDGADVAGLGRLAALDDADHAGFRDADGYFYIHDRVKDMIVTGGENVYPAEVENAIFGCPGVADVAVVGAPSERWGEEVKAVVVCAPGQAPTEAEIIAHARARIGAYKAPKTVEFIDALPRNASGKVLRRELRAKYWHGRDRPVG